MWTYISIYSYSVYVHFRYSNQQKAHEFPVFSVICQKPLTAEISSCKKIAQEQCVETKVLGIPCGFLTWLLGSHQFFHVGGMGSDECEADESKQHRFLHRFEIDLSQNDVFCNSTFWNQCVKHVWNTWSWNLNECRWQPCSTDPFIMAIILVATQSSIPYADE